MNVLKKRHPIYDKMRQVKWLMDEIREVCMREWIFGEFLMVDERMVHYKGIYCLGHQYNMPNKPQK